MSQPSENRLITSARYALCLLTASGVLLSGCASSGVGSVAQTTRAEYYPSCYEPVSHLRSTDNAVRNSAITGAITGGLLGAWPAAWPATRTAAAMPPSLPQAAPWPAARRATTWRSRSRSAMTARASAPTVPTSTAAPSRSTVAWPTPSRRKAATRASSRLCSTVARTSRSTKPKGASAWPRSSAACRRPTPCWSPPTAVPARTSATTPRPTRKTCSRSAYRAPR